jgi:drug/metabolite transporter (DMT)-like permease
MIAVFWGLAAALVWGTGDFIARFTAREVGPERSFLGAIVAGALALTLWVPFSGPLPVPDAPALGFSFVGGVLNTVSLIFLYAALARGPVTVAAPVFAGHPALAVLLLLLRGVQPSALQWMGMGVTIAGLVLLNRDVGREGRFAAVSAGHVRRTALLALVASVLFSFQLVAMQESRGIIGAFATSWLTRWISLGAIVVWMLLRRRTFRIPWAVVPLVAAQGLLDVSGNLFMLIGSLGPDRAVVAVVSSTFAAVTVVLARLIIREPMTSLQWLSIAVILGGVALLASVG